jgi:hypothetical protein
MSTLACAALAFVAVQLRPPPAPPPIAPPNAPAAAADVVERWAVLPFAVDQMKLNEARRLKDGVRERLAARSGVEVQDDALTNALVDSSKSLGLDCDPREAACAATFGRIVDVDVVIAGGASGHEGRIALMLAFVDVKTGAERRRASALLPPDPDLEAKALDRLFAALVDPSAQLGALSVAGAPAGATVVVDGVARGTLPLSGPVRGLLPGEHVLVVEKQGYIASSRVVLVDGGTSDAESVVLPRDPSTLRPGPGPLQIAAPFALAVLGAAVAVGGGVMGVYGYGPVAAREEIVAARRALSSDDASYPMQLSSLYVAERSATTAIESYGAPLLVAGVATTFVGAGTVVLGATWGVLVVAEALQTASGE